MGNYKNFELEFIQRTLALITQYESSVYTREFKEQYNYTLLLNCLLGLIVMPKEKTISYLPNDRLTDELRKNMGLIESTINENITNLRDFITLLRHSIAHFDFEIRSLNEEFKFDEIVFSDTYNDRGEIACIKAAEFLPFLRYYATWLIYNLEKNKI